MIKLEGDKVFVEKKRVGFCIRQVDNAGLSINDVTSVRGDDDTRRSLAFAYFLWMFFGLVGFHRLYTRHFKSGLAMFLGTTLAVAAIVFLKTTTTTTTTGGEQPQQPPHFTPLLIVATSFLVLSGITWISDSFRLPGLVGFVPSYIEKKKNKKTFSLQKSL